MSNLSSVFGAGFDTNSVEPQDDFEAIPPGKYPVLIDKAEVLQTKKQDGHYIKVCMTILDGRYKNRKLWDNINIQNPSQKCTEIGRRTLSALGHAVGVSYVSSEDQFLGKMCIAHVKVKDGQNEIRTYSAVPGPASTEPAGVTPPPDTPYPVPQSPMPKVSDPYPPVLQQPASTALQGTAVSPTSQPAIETPPWKR